MNKIISFIFLLVFASGCATGYDKERWQLIDQYKKDCRTWEDKHYPVESYSFDESIMATQDLIVKRCQEDQRACNPPRKPERLREIEYDWGLPETPDYCLRN